MNRKKRRSMVKRQKAHLKELNLPNILTMVAREEWPYSKETNRTAVFVSKSFLVQVFTEENNVMRLSINRTVHTGKSWEENITWDEINDIKNDLGYTEYDAVEVYPCKKDIVNVANMRHIFVLPYKLSFAWRNK